MLKQPPDFEFKTYSEGYLRDHMIANQPRHLGAVFLLTRDSCRRGRPTSTATGHEQAQGRTANLAMGWLCAHRPDFPENRQGRAGTLRT